MIHHWFDAQKTFLVVNIENINRCLHVVGDPTVIFFFFTDATWFYIISNHSMSVQILLFATVVSTLYFRLGRESIKKNPKI